MKPVDAVTLEQLQAETADADRAGRWDDALRGYLDLLDRLGNRQSEQGSELLRRVGTVHYRRGDFDEALAWYQRSCEAAAVSGATRSLASGLNCVAVAQQASGRLDEARAVYRQALDAAEHCGHERLAVMIQQNVGTVASTQGDLGGALTAFESALAHHEAGGDEQAMATVLNNIGMVQTDLRIWYEAERSFERALQLAQVHEDGELIGTIQLNRAELYLQQARHDDARDCTDQAFELFGSLGSRHGLGEAFKLYGTLYRRTGKLQLADAHLGAVGEIAADSGFRQLQAEALAEHALVHMELGRNAEALRALSTAHGLFTDLRASLELLDIERDLDALERTYVQIVRAWAESIESKDRYTAGHCQRVADLTCRLAEAVGFTGRDLTWIRMGALLHDVGKITIDSSMLNKSGFLTEDEWDRMRNHAVAGDAIVADLGFPWDIRPMVRNHHERWDGNGYPDRLSGEDIPLTARILCIADVYDALTTTRSYRAAYPHEEAMTIMAKAAGTVLDPTLFTSFRGIIDSQGNAAQPHRGRGRT